LEIKESLKFKKEKMCYGTQKVKNSKRLNFINENSSYINNKVITTADLLNFKLKKSKVMDSI
jgi:hypothetical protein